MKVIVNTSRVLVGLLFIFSGLVKAIDPLGLSYKMQEFFEAWHSGGYVPSLMNALHSWSLSFSLIMITLEVAAGVALLIGFRIKLTSWILLLLMLFFTFLTSYVLFSGKIAACGCFGDCIPLTPKQTFTKDIILTILVLIILLGRKHIRPLFKNAANWIVLLLSIIAVIFLQWYVLKHLPLVDCLPYKKGNNILELRKMPKDAVPDKVEMIFIYEKNGEKKEFDVKHIPDSTWKFADRKEKIIEEGKNNKPLINDFALNTVNGNDTTEAILNSHDDYYLFFIKETGDIKTWRDQYVQLRPKILLPFYIVTPAREAVSNTMMDGKPLFAGEIILSCDATALKTAARSNAVLYLMNGPVIKGKWSAADLSKAPRQLGGFKAIGQ